MSEQAKTEMSCGEYSRAAPWYPLIKWWQSSRLFHQDVGLPPFLEPGDTRRLEADGLQRSLAACSWPGDLPAPLFVPYISWSEHHPSQKISKWRVSMDVAHFSPTEISLGVRGGFLEVEGKHEERPDEHGFIARCFTRKYRLPAEMDATKIMATLSVDGILTVEAPVPETSVPAAFLIPIKVEIDGFGEQAVKPEKDEVPQTDHPEFVSPEDHGEESPLELHGDQVQLGSVTAELQQHEERREQEEEMHEKPAGESHPSVPADDEGTEILQDSYKHRETLESKEIPDEDTSKQPEHKEAVADGEIQVMAGSGKAAVEITQPEELQLGESPQSENLSQEPEAEEKKQEPTE